MNQELGFCHINKFPNNCTLVTICEVFETQIIYCFYFYWRASTFRRKVRLDISLPYFFLSAVYSLLEQCSKRQTQGNQFFRCARCFEYSGCSNTYSCDILFKSFVITFLFFMECFLVLQGFILFLKELSKVSQLCFNFRVIVRFV